MARAGVFIGVDKTGTLQQLNDAAKGAGRMRDWALSQGMPDKTHVKLITDEGGRKVTPDQIFDAINDIAGRQDVDQLLVYFAGHGVNINRGEQWLLSDAPRNTSAAVNVSGSVELARYCGIPHVVFISDACRVAPEGIQAQNVRGVDIFPNDGTGDRAKPVDQFFACLLGRTAAEVRDPALAAGSYTALYTDAMLDALGGKHQAALEKGVPPGEDDTCRYVRPRPLQAYLEAEVPRRIAAMNLFHRINQSPDAIITSWPGWLAKHAMNVGGVQSLPTHIPASYSEFAIQTLEWASQIDLPELGTSGRDASSSEAPAAKPSRGRRSTGLESRAPRPRNVGVDQSDERLAMPFGPDNVAASCGIKLRGARIAEVVAPPSLPSPWVSLSRDLAEIDMAPEDAARSILVILENGTGTLIPALDGFIAGLTFDDGELVDVAYEPSATNWRWSMYSDRAPEVRKLRSAAASASRNGRFRLEGSDADNVARRMQYAKGVDPTLAVYAAYAYRDLQETARIQDMSGYLRNDVGVTFFDIDLLGRKLVGRNIERNERVVPFAPMLAQGWALLKAHRVRLHGALQGIEGSVMDSLWTLYDSAGVSKLRRAIQTGRVL